MVTLYTRNPGLLGSNFGWYSGCPHFSWCYSFPHINSSIVAQLFHDCFLLDPFQFIYHPTISWYTLWYSFVKWIKENGALVRVGGKSSWAPFLRETWVCSVKNVFAYTSDVSPRLQRLDVTANYSGRGFVSVIALIKVGGGGINSPYTLANLNGHQWLSSSGFGASELGI